MLGILLLWLTLSGAVVAVRKDRHISINILACHLTPRTGCMAFAATKTFTAFLCAIVAYYGALLVQIDFEEKSILFANVPAWACELIIPISFTLLSVRFFIAVIEEIRQFKQLQAS